MSYRSIVIPPIPRDMRACFEQAYYRLDLNKVARLRAHQILRARQAEEHDRPLSLADFVEQWAASMPGVDTPEVSLLKVKIRVEDINVETRSF